jgi:uncharacterized protein YidB (DUF937 family)
MSLEQIMKIAQNPQVQQLLKSLLTQFSAGKGGQANMQGLVDQFDQAGLHDQMQSWISGGPNQPVTAQQIQQALGTSAIDQAAAKAGLPPEQAADDLAKVLPEVVNAATPQGQLPAAGAQQMDLDAVLKQLMGSLSQPKQ